MNLLYMKKFCFAFQISLKSLKKLKNQNNLNPNKEIIH